MQGAPPGGNPYKNKNKTASGREVEAFFVGAQYRHEMVRRSALCTESAPEGDPLAGLVVERYSNLVSLDGNAATHDPSKVFQGLTSAVYRAVDTSSGTPYCLRRLEGFRPSNQLNMRLIELWRQFRHPNVVGLHQALTNPILTPFQPHSDAPPGLDEPHSNPIPTPFRRPTRPSLAKPSF